MRFLVSSLALLVLACATPQATQAQPQQTSAPAAATYVLDPAHTQVAFSIDRFGFNHVLGRFDNMAGTVILDQANPERSSVSAVIQVSSLSSGHALRDEHLRSERWLDAAQFPTMRFESTAVRPTGEHTADVTGNLTLHGVTAPVTLNVTLNRIGQSPANGAQAAGFSATGTLSRAAFGINTAANLIGDDVQIMLEVLAQAPANAGN